MIGLFKKTLFGLFILFPALSFSAASSSASGGHEIKLKIAGLRDTMIVVGYYMGDKQLVLDSLKLDRNGSAVLKGADDLEGGIYIVVLPNKNSFEILVSDQQFSIETDTADFYRRMKVTGSPDNMMFRDYRVFMDDAVKKITELQSRSDKNKVNADSVAAIKAQMTAAENQVKDYRMRLMDNYDPKLLMPAIIRALYEPDIPEAPKQPDGLKDAGFTVRYFKAHLFDKLDFCDPRLIRTPFLHSKIMQYLTNLTKHDPDSIIIAVDTIIERSKCNKEVFKYCLSMLTNFFETSEVMGYDKVFVHLCDKYYLTDLAYWADSTLKSNIRIAVEKLRYNLVGVTGQNLLMQDTNVVTHALYDVKAKYTILAFYDPTCSHCKEEIPRLAHLYDSVKVNDIEVYAVGMESDLKEWKSFIREHNLNWINVYDMYDKTNYRYYYNIYMKPIIFLLDENKKIIAKRIDTDGLRNFLKHLLDEKKNNKQ